MDRVVVISTGGTISMVQSAERGGAAPELDGEKLLSGLPEGLADIEIVELFKLPSAHFSLDDIWTIRERVVEFTSRPDVIGVVVVQGTDVKDICQTLSTPMSPRKAGGALVTLSFDLTRAHIIQATKPQGCFEVGKRKTSAT